MYEKISQFKTVGKIVFGPGAAETVGDELKALGAKCVTVITDPGIEKAGILDMVRKTVEKAGLACMTFTGVEPDPRIEIVAYAVEKAKRGNCDAILGVGGGSSMDIAKASAVMMTNPGKIDDYVGVGKVSNPLPPVILVPTTAGTGSEVTSIAVLSDTVNNVKKGVVSDYMYARAAVLDPMLTVGLPSHITASTGLDALTHAIESYTGARATFITETLAIEAIRIIAENLRLAYANGSNLMARSNMLKGSLLAGMAFSNTQTAAAHACALAIGGRFHLPHGVATSLMLPAVMEFNMVGCPDKFAAIAEAFGEDTTLMSPMEGAELAIKSVKRLIEDIGFKMGLRNYGIPESAIPDLARGAMVAARLWENNPRSAALEQVEEMFRKAY
jgi:alcohol dehydrogenase class IV